MEFTSILFIFIFLPFTVILYFLLPFRWWRNSVLLITSLLFYAWKEPVLVLILIGTILINYISGILIGTYHKKEKKSNAKLVTISALAVNLGILCFYKYAYFFGENIQKLFNLGPSTWNLALPIGISFYTFSGISYVVDVYRKIETAEPNIINFGCYIAMFPKLFQGPITRFRQVKDDLRNYKTDIEAITNGSQRLIIGLAKKILIADNLAVVANKVFGSNLNTIGADLAWYGLIAFALQIYFDFSGYSDIAIGLGKIFGFHFPENFNYPYISKSITEFWRRWHMTLGAWFQTYLFLPLEYARKRVKHWRLQIDLIIVFLLVGVWHGSGWNFIIWGSYYGIIMAVEASWLGKLLKKLPVLVQHVYAIIMILIGWIFFRINDISQWRIFIKALVGMKGLMGITTMRSLNIMLYYPLVILAAILSVPIGQLLKRLIKEKIKLPNPVQYGLYSLLMAALFVLSVAFLLSNGYKSFLYAQF